MKIHNLGFPKIGIQREWKKQIEHYWAGKISLDSLLDFTTNHRRLIWNLQSQAGLDYLPVGDFNLYDHVLNMSLLLGVIPDRFPKITPESDRAKKHKVLFLMARGQAPGVSDYEACEMTKWFDTNYHYIVPELKKDQSFCLTFTELFDEIIDCQAQNHQAKPVLLGPVSYLWLAKTSGEKFDKLLLCEPIIAAYQQILSKIAKLGVDWVQFDEPILSLELEKPWQDAIKESYQNLKLNNGKIMVANYFGSLAANQDLLINLPVDGIHLDVCRSQEEYKEVNQKLAKEKVLSLGVIDGRNVWLSDWQKIVQQVSPIFAARQSNLWLAPSCSLLHCPVSKEMETKIDPELLSWLSFSTEKLYELKMLSMGIENPQDANWQKALAENQAVLSKRRNSALVKNDAVRQKTAAIDETKTDRANAFSVRQKSQQQSLGLPLLPTTTIGSFPQTADIRKIRRAFKEKKCSEQEYDAAMKNEIQQVVKKQESFGLDVLVHGEPERNDMVEYFGEMLKGYMFTANGWVQSYGTRCVKPPIIYGDVYRERPMTTYWSEYAQSLTTKKMKGMLTGPNTMLCWSFVRDDLPRKEVCLQLAISLQEEVLDLEKAGIQIIQIDEPAIREGLPLKKSEWTKYLLWAVACFKVTCAKVKDETQIHTHMCYSEFNEIFRTIATMDADVISIEASRSKFDILDALKEYPYPNEIGPGIYDIHSPNVPAVESMTELLKKALRYIPAEKLWVNPDCGLKTRAWAETEQALKNMTEAAQIIRSQLKQHQNSPA